MTPEQLNDNITKFKNSLLSSLAEELKDEMKERIDSSTDVNGQPMIPLAEVTLKTKARKGYPLKPWVGTGALQESINVEVTGNTIVISALDYFQYVNKDRPIAGFDDDKVDKLLQKLISEVIDHG
jgi:hypothetical protein